MVEAAVAQHLFGPDQAQVAEQDGGGLTEPLGAAGQPTVAVPVGELHVGGRPAATQLRIVHDVVLQQRERVQQFQARGGAQRGVRRLGAAQPAQEHERRAQTLAAADECDKHVGGDVDARAAQVDRAPIGDEPVDGVEH